MLVYDFMCNGSLDKYLFDEPKATLSWNQRLKIVRGVAAGPLYGEDGEQERDGWTRQRWALRDGRWTRSDGPGTEREGDAER
ncbi:hypothetical protein AAC387_Pa02g0840 [Persea americana]